MTRAAIGIGANLGDASSTVRRAIGRLDEAGRVVARSSLYRTPPWGVLDQPDFINAVAIVETSLEPLALLHLLKGIERDLGRVPAVRWGPRAIDLDILTYGDMQFESDALAIPHPRLAERAFVLVPLAEIDPSYAAMRDALPSGDRSAVVRVGDDGLPRS